MNGSWSTKGKDIDDYDDDKGDGAKAPKALQQTKWVLGDIERRRVVGQRSQVTTNNREVSWTTCPLAFC